MPDFAAIAGLLGNVKGIFDLIGGVTGSLSKTDGNLDLLESLFAGSTEAA